jgi:phosphatidylethanolamine/phosphatidyl-N-methylethanolamine N-methyltransferase
MIARPVMEPASIRDSRAAIETKVDPGVPRCRIGQQPGRGKGGTAVRGSMDSAQGAPKNRYHRTGSNAAHRKFLRYEGGKAIMKAATGPLRHPDNGSDVISMLLFALETLKSPLEMGAICPSSGSLAQQVARQLPVDLPGKVVELGAGTGVITRALLRHGVPAHDLVAVERSPVLARRLRRSLPQITVAEGDAAHLAWLLGSQRSQVRAVVSGLPLRSLPRPAVAMILSSLDDALAAGGLFVQFTYALRAPLERVPEHFTRLASRIVWRNFPPARVDVFRKES